MVTTRQIVLVKLCGNEAAQVIAGHLPALLHRAMPATTLCTIAAISDVARFTSSLGSVGVVALLPTDFQQRCSAWRRLMQELKQDVTVLPIFVGSADSGEDGNGTDQSLEGVAEALTSFEGLVEASIRSKGTAYVLPPVRVSGRDAFIEHGGHFHLDRDVAKDLSRRLSLLNDARRLAAPTAHRTQDACRLRYAVGAAV